MDSKKVDGTDFESITHTIHGTGIFTYIYYKNQPNVGKYTIHGWYGSLLVSLQVEAEILQCTWSSLSEKLTF